MAVVGGNNMNKMKYTIWGQMLSMVRSHAFTAIVIFLIWLVTAGMWEVDIGSRIFGILGSFCYVITIYNCACSCAQADKRTASPLKAYPAKGLIIPAFLLAVNVLITIMYKYIWIVGGDGQYLREGWAILLNVLTLAWVAPYDAFLGMAQGHMELRGYLIMYLLPFVISAIGYFAGFKGIDIYGKINSIAYEKKKKN